MLRIRSRGLPFGDPRLRVGTADGADQTSGTEPTRFTEIRITDRIGDERPRRHEESHKTVPDINGFGRIGRGFYRALDAQKAEGNGVAIEVVAVNDLTDNTT